MAMTQPATAFTFNRYHIDLTTGEVCFECVECEDLEDALGGIARATKLLGSVEVTDPYDPSAPLVMNLGRLSGTRVMTGLRTFFHGYSPLKTSLSGAPGLMWSAGSGHFGTKLKGLGIDEVIFTGLAPNPTLLRIHPSTDPDGPDGPATFEFLAADDLEGRLVNDRIQDLYGRYPEAHFAVIGPAGENWETVRYAAVALSTDNQLKTGDPKPRFCGRGGYGGVMGSKNLWAIVADGPNPTGGARGLKEINKEINLGEGSARYRDREGDLGGTWRTMKLMQEAGGLPEYNFGSTGTDVSVPLLRPAVEQGPYVIKSESCYLCGIRCHKNVYDDVDGEAGPFRAKVDYEPITLLTSNLGIFDPDPGLDLIELVDELGMDSISLGVTLGYVMDYNRRNPDDPIVDGLAFGDIAATTKAIDDVARGRLPQVGQGVMRLASQTGAVGYAMHSKGVEYPAYLPQTNPGYPWALAGGHMSMRTFFLLLVERETGVDYWVDAITDRGPLFMRDDITGLCKFCFISDDWATEAIRTATDLEISSEELREVIARTFLRGYAAERRQGFTDADYTLPAESHEPNPNIDMPYVNSPEFFTATQEKVLARLDERARTAGYF
jgi:aldehyde:ferredoxin oxidoreductase